MKKLQQLKLQSAVVLLEKEMKAVHGGSGGGGGCIEQAGRCIPQDKLCKIPQKIVLTQRVFSVF